MYHPVCNSSGTAVLVSISTYSISMRTDPMSAADEDTL